MDELEMILSLIVGLQEDETLDLSNYATTFADIAGNVSTIQERLASADGFEEIINALKSENSDLAKRITSDTLTTEDGDDEEIIEEEAKEDVSLEDGLEEIYKERE